MKKLLFLLCMCFVSCSSTIHIACNEPGIEIYIEDVNYGQPPVLLKVPHGQTYIDVSFRKNGMEIHKQRINFVDGKNYYEVTIPQHLQKSVGQRKYYSTH